MLATHGEWCGAVTWPTKCPGCSDPVFFFRCNCGCKVFFDSLGSPWPLHECETSWTRNLIRTRSPNGTISVQLAEGVSATRAPDSFSVDAHTVSAGNRLHKSRTPDPIISVPPDGAQKKVTIVGILREKDNKIDVSRALNISRQTSISAAFLGPLAKGDWGKITIHEPSASGNVLHSYTIFVPTHDISGPNSDIGVTVLANIQSVNVPRFAHVWASVHYEVLG